MSAPASSSSSSSDSSSSSSSPSSSSQHVAIRFFDSQPRSIENLLESSDRSWQIKGRQQLATALGLISSQQLDELNPSSIEVSGKGWLQSAAAEQSEVMDFIRWVRDDVPNLVRQITEIIPITAYEQVSHLISQAELHDFSPKGRVDDEIFSSNRTVWERITRGCAVLKLITHTGETIYRWAVRANKKFTGHEDEAAVSDSKLYCIGGDQATSVVVSHKCNGSVLHLSARDITLSTGETMRWVFLGSKKVHVGAVWNNEKNSKGSSGVVDWMEKMKVFHAERHEYVSEMVQYIQPHLADTKRAQLILDSLALFRLTLNAEYISSIGTGPTDNEAIYGLKADGREAFAFMLTFNTMIPSHGCELGLDMLFGLYLMHQWGFKTVSAFEIKITELSQMKAQVTTLPDVEGAVLYYSNADGLIQLEKWKSSGYVVLRAIREKLKPFIFGTRDRMGLAQMIEKIEINSQQSEWTCSKITLTPQQIEEEKNSALNQLKQKRKKQAKKKKNSNNAAEAASLSVNELKDALSESEHSSEDGSSETSSSSSATPSIDVSKDTYLEYRHASIDSIGSSFMAEGGMKVAENVWRIPCPSDAAIEAQVRTRIDQAFTSVLLENPISESLSRCSEKITDRIQCIDHIPMSVEERTAWINDSKLFLQWLRIQLLQRKRWHPKEVMNMYSKLWTLFKAEQQQQQQ